MFLRNLLGMKRLFAYITAERALYVSFSLAISALSIVAILLLLPKPKVSLLGDYETPQHVNAMVPGVEGPAVLQGGMLDVVGRRCVTSERVSVITFRTFTRVDPPGAVVAGSTRAGELVKGSGHCVPSILSIRIPEGVGPGVWRIDGIDISTQSGDVKVWSSETFTVVPR